MYMKLHMSHTYMSLWRTTYMYVCCTYMYVYLSLVCHDVTNESRTDDLMMIGNWEIRLKTSTYVYTPSKKPVKEQWTSSKAISKTSNMHNVPVKSFTICNVSHLVQVLSRSDYYPHLHTRHLIIWSPSTWYAYIRSRSILNILTAIHSSFPFPYRPTWLLESTSDVLFTSP